MRRFFGLSALAVAVAFYSCGDDDDNSVEPPRLLAEQVVEDDAEIRAWLSTHFYNYEEFENPPVGFDYKIVVDTIEGENIDKIPLIDQVQQATVLISNEQFNLPVNETDIPHTYYYLVAREGVGPSPSVADSVFVRYEGLLLDGNTFDGSVSTPIWFDSSSIQAPLQGFRGFSEAMVNFKSGGAPIINPDGTFSVEDYGIGMFILPSGLAAFNSVSGIISQYTPIRFDVDLFTINQTDHDGDGIPSIMEDVNGNGYLYDDNTDEASENQIRTFNIVDFQDADDDGDGVLTKEEINLDEEGNLILPFPDSDRDGIPDYLDADSSPPKD